MKTIQAADAEAFLEQAKLDEATIDGLRHTALAERFGEEAAEGYRATSKGTHYAAHFTTDALGIVAKFLGPGLSEYDDVHVLQPPNEWATTCMARDAEDPETLKYSQLALTKSAQLRQYHTLTSGVARVNREVSAICMMLEKAFRAGQEAKEAELRAVLGAARRPQR